MSRLLTQLQCFYMAVLNSIQQFVKIFTDAEQCPCHAGLHLLSLLAWANHQQASWSHDWSTGGKNKAIYANIGKEEDFGTRNEKHSFLVRN